ncbi:hypothetical protein [Methylobacterium durans]
MMRALLAGLALVTAGPALAQILPGPLPGARPPGVVIQNQPNTTGNSRDVVIAPGATGAETITTNSAAGGNASFPERAIPNGSANGGGGGSR